MRYRTLTGTTNGRPFTITSTVHALHEVDPSNRELVYLELVSVKGCDLTIAVNGGAFPLKLKKNVRETFRVLIDANVAVERRLLVNTNGGKECIVMGFAQTED